MTNFNGLSEFSTVVESGSLFESGRLAIGKEIFGANTLCNLFDELSFNALYRLLNNLGAFTRSIGGCYFCDDVRFHFSIVLSHDLSGAEFELSLGLGR